MDCSCTGFGDTPEKMEDTVSEDDSRDCQFDFKKKRPLKQITNNQLLYWEHYKRPVSTDLLRVKI